jgi:hypothetical protein
MEEQTAVYAWAGSTLRVFADGEAVHSFDQAVPDVVMKLSVKETVTMLFGRPPVPTEQEGGSRPKRRWWRFWNK